MPTPPDDLLQLDLDELTTRARAVRDAFRGIRRFDELRRDLDIARPVLADRLRKLVDHGVLQKVQYQAHPPRSEYRLTPMGVELSPALVALMRWGDRHLSGELGPPVLLRHNPCGHVAEPLLVCSHCREELDPHEVTPERGDADELARSHMNLS